MSYSQLNEEEYILQFFGNKKGSFLDIGAADGITFSNVYQLLLNGWKGVSVEPETKTFVELQNNYKQFGIRAELANFVINAKYGMVVFYENGQLSSLSTNHIDKWAEHTKINNATWLPSYRFAITLDTVLIKFSSRKFDFINLDIEGMNIAVIKATDWNLAPHCKLVCLEHDGRPEEIENHLKQFGFTTYMTNEINILLSR